MIHPALILPSSTGFTELTRWTCCMTRSTKSSSITPITLIPPIRPHWAAAAGRAASFTLLWRRFPVLLWRGFPIRRCAPLLWRGLPTTPLLAQASRSRNSITSTRIPSAKASCNNPRIGAFHPPAATPRATAREMTSSSRRSRGEKETSGQNSRTVMRPCHNKVMSRKHALAAIPRCVCERCFPLCTILDTRWL
jgi:hypothetical protein